MTSRMLLTAVIAGGVLLQPGCQAPVQRERIGAGDDTLSFFGPGRARLDFGRLPVIRFYPAASELSDPETVRLAEAMRVLADGKRLLLVGVGDVEVPVEHARQQGLARALVVRRALIGQGAEPSQVMVTGLAPVEVDGLTGRGESGPRVECGVVR